MRTRCIMQGVSKGLAVEKLVGALNDNGKPPDFVLCIGDDRSDEDMFESIYSTTSRSLFPTVPEVFACTVGQKPSKAKYYVEDTSEVIRLLAGISSFPTQKHKMTHSLVSFERACLG